MEKDRNTERVLADFEREIDRLVKDTFDKGNVRTTNLLPALLSNVERLLAVERLSILINEDGKTLADFDMLMDDLFSIVKKNVFEQTSKEAVEAYKKKYQHSNDFSEQNGKKEDNIEGAV